MAFEAKDYAISDILNKSVFDIPRNQLDTFGRNHIGRIFTRILFSQLPKQSRTLLEASCLKVKEKRMAFHITLSLMDSNDLPQ